MGAAVEVFEGAQAIEVERNRFLPVKTTNDLLVMRSDVYSLGDDGLLRQEAETVPYIDLDKSNFALVPDFDHRFPAGPPSLVSATSLAVHGDWTFGAGVVISGDVVLGDEGGTVADGQRLSGQ
jgi:UTP--glucose-1-phosphate uridylyltransferase